MHPAVEQHVSAGENLFFAGVAPPARGVAGIPPLGRSMIGHSAVNDLSQSRSALAIPGRDVAELVAAQLPRAKPQVHLLPHLETVKSRCQSHVDRPVLGPFNFDHVLDGPQLVEHPTFVGVAKVPGALSIMLQIS